MTTGSKLERNRKEILWLDQVKNILGTTQRNVPHPFHEISGWSSAIGGRTGYGPVKLSQEFTNMHCGRFASWTLVTADNDQFWPRMHQFLMWKGLIKMTSNDFRNQFWPQMTVRIDRYKYYYKTFIIKLGNNEIRFLFNFVIKMTFNINLVWPHFDPILTLFRRSKKFLKQIILPSHDSPFVFLLSWSLSVGPKTEKGN